MKTRIITGFFFTVGVLLLLFPFNLAPWNQLLFLLIIALGAAFELERTLSGKTRGVLLPYSIPMLFLIIFYQLFPSAELLSGLQDLNPVLFSFFYLGISLFSLLSYSMLFVILWVLKKGYSALSDGLAWLACGFYYSFPLLIATLLLLFFPSGLKWILLSFFAPWFTDVFAYFFGSFWGRHPMLPNLSPKKTWEGFAGGLLGACVLTFIVLYFSSSFTLVQKTSWSLIFGLLLGLVAQLGDWLASAVKRARGIKDFGRIFPGHGGMMDRFDSVFFTLPLTYLFACIIF